MKIKIEEQAKLDQKVKLKIDYMAKILQLNLKIKVIIAQEDEDRTGNVRIQLIVFMISEVEKMET